MGCWAYSSSMSPTAMRETTMLVSMGSADRSVWADPLLPDVQGTLGSGTSYADDSDGTRMGSAIPITGCPSEFVNRPQVLGVGKVLLL